MSDLTKKWNKSHSEIPSNKSVSQYAVKTEKEFPRGSVVCDLGGGTGVDAIYFLCQGHQVILVDISDYALSVAVDNAKEKDFDLEIHRVTLGQESIPLADEKVDIVYSRLALHYFDKSQTTDVFKEVFRIMKKGAKAFITLKSPDDAKEMGFLRSTADEKETGIFDDKGDVKSRFSKEQLEEILAAAGITNFKVNTFIEVLGDRIDKVKSGSRELLLNEVQFTK